MHHMLPVYVCVRVCVCRVVNLVTPALPTQNTAWLKVGSSQCASHAPCVCVCFYVFVVSSRAPTCVPRFCLGEIVIGGAIVQWDNDGAPLVAVSSTARKSYVGPLNKTDIADLDISYAVRDRAIPRLAQPITVLAHHEDNDIGCCCTAASFHYIFGAPPTPTPLPATPPPATTTPSST